MVHKKRTDINDIFVQALYLDDHVLLKAILQGMKYTRINNLQAMMGAKDELGGFTPFEFVCLQGNSELATMLIDTGVVDVNKTGQNNWTPLHAAAYSGNSKTVQMLINSCADCFAKDDNNNLPVDLTNDTHIRNVLLDTMRQKNLKRFNEIVENESESNNTPRTKERHQRSKSCFANVSLLKLSEIKTQLMDRRNSNEKIDEAQFSCEIKLTLRKWKTYSDLTLESILDATC